MGLHEGHRERKKDQFRLHGLDAFAEHEALELLLYYAIPRRDTNPIAHALLDRFGSLEKVLAAPIEELEKVPGVGPSAALLIKLVPQITSKARRCAAANEKVLDTTERIEAAELTGGVEIGHHFGGFYLIEVVLVFLDGYE